MKRAYREASGFAREREAFGGPIDRFPLVRENLAVMKSEEAAAFASSMHLTELVARIDDGSATDEDMTWHRLLVNGNKFLTSLAATQVVRRGIETLGGNGTIEDFSPLPRLYRDAIVFESWEGTHNVLCAQALRDLERFDAVDLAVQRAGASEDLAARLRRSIAEPEFGALHFRRQLAELVRSLQVRALRDSDPDAAGLIERRHLVRGWNPEADPDYGNLVDRVLAGDTESK
jgi:Acyl-CoA dehydrogenase, C-terminal domain